MVIDTGVDEITQGENKQREKGRQKLKEVLQTLKSNGLLQDEELRKGSEGRPESGKCQESLS